MAMVTVVLGLCGSGKTTFVKNLVGVTVFDEGVAPGWPKHVDFQNALAGEHVRAPGEVPERQAKTALSWRSPIAL
jgi:hypothetical protein